jgi:hypothetical protein
VGEHVRVMIEFGKKKRSVASAFDWPGWDRSGKTEEAALQVLETYRPRYAKVAELAGLGQAFAQAGALEVVERQPGIGMTDFYGLSMKSAGPEFEQMSEEERERKLALLRACWAYFDATAERVSPVLRLGPRGGGRERERIIRHANGAEIDEFSRKLGMSTPLEVRGNRDDMLAYRDEYVAAIRDHNARGATARNWTVQFLIRHSCYHMLDHAWEMEDRDQTGAAPT